MKSIKSHKSNTRIKNETNLIENLTKGNLKSIFINQEKNFSNKHGFHYRSSAQFYFRVDETLNIKTYLILFNYFKIKNQNEVAICVTLRDSKGDCIERKHLRFDKKSVIIVDGEFWNVKQHIGSVEVEYFSLTNLVIPYAAVIGVYETNLGISYVHTYSRCYSKHEMESGFTVMEGCESNWTIRDTNEVESFTILHNGFLKVKEQVINLKIISESGRVLEQEYNLSSLNPYEIVEIVPQKIFKNLSNWLNNEQANCSIQFKINGGFTRTLVGNRTKINSDMQVTHSNFAYNHHKTDFIDTDKGFMPYPNFDIKNGQINIYPDMPSGKYFIDYEESKNSQKLFSSGEYISYKVEKKQNFDILLGKLDSELPSRIPIGFSGNSANASKEILPFEISLGILSKARPKKRFWWGPIGNSKTKNSLVLGLLKDIYGEHNDEKIIIRIFNDQNNEYKELIYSSDDIKKMNYRIDLEKDNLKEILKFGMYTVFSNYPGFFVYSLTENKEGSIAIEHGF